MQRPSSQEQPANSGHYSQKSTKREHKHVYEQGQGQGQGQGQEQEQEQASNITENNPS